MPWFAILDASAQPGVAAALGVNASGMLRAHDSCVIVFLSHLSMFSHLLSSILQICININASTSTWMILFMGCIAVVICAHSSCYFAAPLSHPLETSSRVVAYDGSQKMATIFTKDNGTDHGAQSRNVFEWASTLAVTLMSNVSAALSPSDRSSLDKVATRKSWSRTDCDSCIGFTSVSLHHVLKNVFFAVCCYLGPSWHSFSFIFDLEVKYLLHRCYSPLANQVRFSLEFKQTVHF